MFSNLKKPRWIALTIFIVVMVYLFWQLSQWQFDRSDERNEKNKTISSSLNAEPIQIKDLDIAADLNPWQKVSLVGSYVEDSKLVRKRYFESDLGFWVITPLLLENNQTILINRGWISIGDSANSSKQIPQSAQGNVILTGYIQKMEEFKQNPSDLPKEQILNINHEHFQTQVNKSVFIQLSESVPQDKQVRILPTPEISDGPHFSYAIQWIIFALLLPIGWYVLLKNEKN